MDGWELAQINVARLIAPLDDPRIADFVGQLASVNALAEASPGFRWRLQLDAEEATDLAHNHDPFLIVNMSVWESLEALRDFTYRSREHMQAFRDRAQWFEKMEVPHGCLWWVRQGHIPSIAEGRQKLAHYQRFGPTPEAFWFGRHFPAPAAEALLSLQ